MPTKTPSTVQRSHKLRSSKSSSYVLPLSPRARTIEVSNFRPSSGAATTGLPGSSVGLTQDSELMDGVIALFLEASARLTSPKTNVDDIDSQQQLVNDPPIPVTPRDVGRPVMLQVVGRSRRSPLLTLPEEDLVEPGSEFDE